MPDDWIDEPYEELPDVTGLKPVRRVRDAATERLEPRDALRRYWGYDSFRSMQAEAVAAAYGVDIDTCAQVWADAFERLFAVELPAPARDLVPSSCAIPAREPKGGAG